MGNTLWIEDIVATPPCFTNFRVDMAGFKDLCKVVVRRSAFSTFSNEQNEVELKGEEKWKVEMQIFTSERRFEFVKDA
jgi:hypothetical protein